MIQSYIRHLRRLAPDLSERRKSHKIGFGTERTVWLPSLEWFWVALTRYVIGAVVGAGFVVLAAIVLAYPQIVLLVSAVTTAIFGWLFYRYYFQYRAMRTPSEIIARSRDILLLIIHCGTMFLAPFAFLVSAATLIINFANRANKSHLSSPVDPIGVFGDAPFTFFLLNYRWPILFVCGIVFGLLLAAMYRRITSRLKSTEIVDQMAREYHELSFELRRLTILSLSQIDEYADAQSPAYRRAVSEKVEHFLIASTNRIAAMFEKYTGGRCRVCIALYSKGLAKIIVQDERDMDRREALADERGWYHVSMDKAFASIIGDKTCVAYRRNCLRVASIFGRQEYAHASGHRQSGARLVVPITAETDGPSINDQTVWGFLSVENNIGGFDLVGAQHLLQSFARMYCALFTVIASDPSEIGEMCGVKTAQMIKNVETTVMLGRELCVGRSHQSEGPMGFADVA